MLDTDAASARHGRVLQIVQGLVNELQAGRRPPSVRLSSSLDRDLGLGSLERVELLVRLETAFSAPVSEQGLANAVTVADLLGAMDGPAAADPADATPAAVTEQRDGRAAPASLTTLVDVLRWHVERTPDRVHIYLREDDGREYQITYAALWQQAQVAASALAAQGVARGECVALLLRTERAFFVAYCGALLAGAVPVPLYPPFRADQIDEYATRQAAILRNAEARVLVTFDRAERVAALLKPLAPTLTSVRTLDDLRAAGAPDLPHAGTAGDALALIQYTSGSTGIPKGVALTHANLIANITAFGRALDIRQDDVGISWLPLYHDMGLIGMWLGALYHGLPVAIMSPLAFLSRPSRWLRAFDVHRGTLSAAPNFAYELCARRVTDDEMTNLNLGSWRTAMNGAEAVSADTIGRFTRRFAPNGFRPDAMCPVYGLAETSLCLTMPPMGQLPHVDRIARDAFQQSRAIRPATPDGPALAFVGCGGPVPGSEVRLVDRDGAELGQRAEGRIQFRGPSATRGYYRNPDATRELIEDGWLNTGDLGYWSDGHLFITGRIKDLIIAGGRNLHPQDIEEAVAAVPGVRRGCVAAFGSFDPAVGTERLVVVAESRERDAERRDAIKAEATRAVVDVAGVPPDVLVLARPGAIPKTSSGKIRRGATRDLFERDALEAPRTGAWRQWVRLLWLNVTWRVRRAAGWLAAAVFTLYLWLLVGAGLLVLRAALLFARTPDAGGRVSRAWCRAVFRLGAFDVRWPRDDELQLDGGAVFVGNHASYMDALLLRAALPPHVKLAAKDRLLSYPFIGALFAGSNVVAIARGRRSSAQELADLVRAGGSFAIFPEGTFVRRPGLLPFRLGAFQAAVDASRPVVPLALVGTRAAWPDETLLVRRRPIAVVAGPLLEPRSTDWQEMVRLRDLARDWIARTTGEQGSAGYDDASFARASGQTERPTT